MSDVTTRGPRRSKNRVMLGVRWKRSKDRACRRAGHRPDARIAQRQMGGALWPVCTRCGFAVEPDHPNGWRDPGVREA